MRAAGPCLGAALLLLVGNESLQTAVAEGDTRTISFHHMHTGEDITVTYKRNGRYDDEALKQLDWFMRDWRRSESIHMDPQLFDVLWEVTREVGAKAPIQVVCGYRSPQTNSMLRARSSGVAEFSQHTNGQAMDFYIPGVPLDQVRAVGLRLQRGGVGFYPTSGSPFVHLDTGSVRHWPRMTHDQLVKVFPNGRTVHVPSDGHPLPGYALALADVERRGGTVSNLSLAAASADGLIDENRTSETAPKRSLLADLFGFKQESEDSAPAAAPAPTRAAARASNTVQRVATATTTEASANSETKTETARPIPLPRVRPLPVMAAAAAQPARPAPVKLAAASPMAPEMNIVAARGAWPIQEPQTTATVGAGSPVLAYAAPDQTVATTSASPMGRALPRMSSTTIVEQTAPDTTVVSKQALAPLSPPAELRAAAVTGERFDQPWLRATMLAPNATRYLTTLRLGATDMRPLREFLRKPESALVMSFASDPHYGMVAERFTGSAVVFLATANFAPAPRTAALRR